MFCMGIVTIGLGPTLLIDPNQINHTTWVLELRQSNVRLRSIGVDRVGPGFDKVRGFLSR